MSIDHFLCNYDEALSHFDLGGWHFFDDRVLRGPNWKIAYDGYLDFYQIHYYDYDGELYKTITNSDFRELDKGKYMVTGMKAVNHDNNRSSEMVMEKISVTPTDPSYFTVAYLEKE